MESKSFEKRAEVLRERFAEYGCGERFELSEVIDKSHLRLRCKACGNSFTRHTAFLSPSKSHNVCCNRCGIHADGSFTHPRSEVKRRLDKDAVADYYSNGFSIAQTAAKFHVKESRVAKIVDEAGLRRGPAADAESRMVAASREKARRTKYSQPKEKRKRTISERFKSKGCSARFEIVEITNRTHVILRCIGCGYEFKRETSFIDSDYVSPNIGCPGCGIHVDGTRSHTREYKKEVDENAIAEYYGKGFSVKDTARKFGIPYTRVNIILDRSGVTRREDEKTPKPQKEYAHELTGEPFLDEEFICAWCGRAFTRHDYMVHEGRKRLVIKQPEYCSRKCSAKAGDFIRRRVGSAGSIRHARKRRSEIRQIPLGELMDRDGGICQICGEKVDLSDISFDECGYTHTGERYPTVDHIIPVSKGGKTEWGNVQLACKGCNSKKHDRTMEEYRAITQEA